MGKLRRVWANLRGWLQKGPSPAQAKFRLEWAERQREREDLEMDDGVVAVYRHNQSIPRTPAEQRTFGLPHGVSEDRILPARGREDYVGDWWTPRVE